MLAFPHRFSFPVIHFPDLVKFVSKKLDIESLSCWTFALLDDDGQIHARVDATVEMIGSCCGKRSDQQRLSLRAVYPLWVRGENGRTDHCADHCADHSLGSAPARFLALGFVLRGKLAHHWRCAQLALTYALAFLSLCALGIFEWDIFQEERDQESHTANDKGGHERV